MANTVAATLDVSLIDVMNEEVIVSGAGLNRVDAFVERETSVNGKSVDFTIYTKLAAATTALTDGTDPTGVAMADALVQVTPKEYGQVISPTKLANLQTGGKANRAAAKLTGINIAETTNQLGVTALEAGTNTTAAATLGTLAKADMRAAVKKLVNKKIGKINGLYVAFMHPDQVSDIQDDYISIAKNTNLDLATNGVVATYEGCIIVEEPDVTAGKVVIFGMGGLGRAVSEEPAMTITGPFDSLGRIINIGWLGVIEYKLIDDAAVEVITGA